MKPPRQLRIRILYDDDCGICTKFSMFLKTIFPQHEFLAMHEPSILISGYETIGEKEYWHSFHIIKNGDWYTGGDAISELVRIFPLGKFLGMVVDIKFVKKSLVHLLNHFRRVRSQECVEDRL